MRLMGVTDQWNENYPKHTCSILVHKSVVNGAKKAGVPWLMTWKIVQKKQPQPIADHQQASTHVGEYYHLHDGLASEGQHQEHRFDA